jgi:hypothetical protein
VERRGDFTAGTLIDKTGIPPARLSELPVMAAPLPSWDGDPVDYDAAIDCLV